MISIFLILFKENSFIRPNQCCNEPSLKSQSLITTKYRGRDMNVNWALYWKHECQLTDTTLLKIQMAGLRNSTPNSTSFIGVGGNYSTCCCEIAIKCCGLWTGIRVSNNGVLGYCTAYSRNSVQGLRHASLTALPLNSLPFHTQHVALHQMLSWGLYQGWRDRRRAVCIRQIRNT